MGSLRPLDAYPLMRTSTIEELEAALGRIYAKPTMQVVGSERKLEAIHNHCRLERTGLTYGSYGIDARWRFPETEYFACVFPVRGAVEFRLAGASAIADADRGLLVPANADFNMINDAAYERLNLVIHPAILTRKLGAFLGESFDSLLKMDSLQPATGWLGQNMRGHIGFLADLLSAPTAPPSPVLAEFEEMLLMTFLHGVRHNYSHLLEQTPSDVDARQVRQAEEFIEEHWAEASCIDAIATAMGVGARHLDQKARRIRGQSLRAFRRNVGLRNARTMLMDADAAVTIEDAAGACGYIDVARFARDYLRQFGEHPDDTLARRDGAEPTRH